MEFLLKTDSTRTIVKLLGRFDAKGRQTFLSALQLARKEPAQEIMIDLREVSYIDSVALGLLTAAHRRCLESGGGFSLQISEGTVKQALDLMNIKEIMPVVTKE